jgi:uncharacterized protein YjiS (DUF1127 family)
MSKVISLDAARSLVRSNGPALPAMTEIRAALERTTSVLEATDIRAKVEAVRRYAKEAGNRELEIMAAQARLHAERRAGQILIEMSDSGARHGRGRENDSAPQLADLGIGRKQAMQWQWLAKVPEKAFNRLLKDIPKNFSTARLLQTLGAFKDKHAVHFSSKSPEYLTPRHIVDAVIAVMEEIDLDPCAESPGPPTTGTFNVPAKYHYTKNNDGLTKPWEGRVYMNPPYGEIVETWVDNLVELHKDEQVSEAIALLAARTDTSFFAKLSHAGALVCFIQGRLVFAPSTDPAPFPSAVFYLGDRADRFVEIFSQLGPVYGVY